jgi:crotonobetainyl-CoA:carnitine CoA-transferase CaiB-like acyl-CoA transferase
VIVENMTPSTKKDLHIDYETVRGFKPDIIYASLSGLGQSNDRKYYDILAQAESGLLSLSGTEDTPMKIGPSVTDAFAGLMLAFGISGALHYRNETGFGQYLDVSMLGSSLQLLESYLIEASVTGKNPKRSGNQDSMISPFGLYRTKNGYIAMAAGNDRQWQSLSKFIYEKQIFDLSLFNTNEKRLLNNIQLTSILESVFIRYDSAVLIRQLQELQIACSLLQTMKEVSANTSLIASGDLLQSKIPGLGMCTSPGRNIRFSAVQKHNTAPAPKIGEHNRDYDI